MIIEKANYVESHTIAGAWREVMWLCIKRGYDFVVKGKTGSYIGQIRKQLPFVSIRIIQPGSRPLSPILPPGIPAPTTDEKIEQVYFPNYLMNATLAKDEEYTYGSFISPQLLRIIEMLKESNGNTNQACITIGDTNSVNLTHPPCLKLLDFKVVNKKLNLTVFFRSWDLFTGLPENLGGLQLVKEFIVSSLPKEMEIEDGELIAYSDGLHLYDQYFSLADTLNVDKISIDKKVLDDKNDFAKKL